MKKTIWVFALSSVMTLLSGLCAGQNAGALPIGIPKTDTGTHYIYDPGSLTHQGDSAPTVTLGEVNIVSFKTMEEWNQYYLYRSRIQKVMPYVKIAKELYTELHEKEGNSKRKDYRVYRKDVEKEMRSKFEKELKDLTIGQGQMLFKLINRETGNNSYAIIKELKGPLVAWFSQMMAKRYGYNLKDIYDPKQEKMIELIIKQMGPAYKV
ncbi:MAG: hypothetical protein JWO06_3273 [Bacteroidota bacterium]|nr:hypothetical protein [Bacteroidota bacterium]